MNKPRGAERDPPVHSRNLLVSDKLPAAPPDWSEHEGNERLYARLIRGYSSGKARASRRSSWFSFIQKPTTNDASLTNATSEPEPILLAEFKRRVEELAEREQVPLPLSPRRLRFGPNKNLDSLVPIRVGVITEKIEVRVRF